ncbi:hypothetical protein NPX13_g9140 [Xylaria arbuscula]|uniref:Protein kinase domain-containing protein n=1 Tax=Xylaria arbuscula TaxID=114810 RepID=A0A9W8THZ1_9PEZI|nr:hypothetical protein NPX13_g9140 [Xylaria arbuscula]
MGSDEWREFLLTQLALVDSKDLPTDRIQKGKQGSVYAPILYDGQVILTSCPPVLPKIALKTFIFKDRLDSEKAIKDAEREYQNLKSLPHPSIVRFIGFDPTPAEYVVNLRMEWASTVLSGNINGVLDLEDIILERDGRHMGGKKAYLPEEFIWHVLFHLSAALALCHHGIQLHISQREEQIDAGEILGQLMKDPPTHLRDITAKNPTIRFSTEDILFSVESHHDPIVHRDIKPSNILLTDPIISEAGREWGRRVSLEDKGLFSLYPKVLLGDFGLSVSLREARTVGIGTPSYLAPEVPTSALRPDSKDFEWKSSCDVFSLGATMHHLISLSLLSSVDMENLSYVPDYSSEIQDLIAKCYSYALESRLTALDILDVCLRRAGWKETLITPYGGLISLKADQVTLDSWNECTKHLKRPPSHIQILKTPRALILESRSLLALGEARKHGPLAMFIAGAYHLDGFEDNQALRLLEIEAEMSLRSAMQTRIDETAQISQPKLLKSILNRGVLMPLFHKYKASKSSWANEKTKVDRLYDDIHDNYIIVLAILILLGRASEIIIFRENKLSDAKLPLKIEDPIHAEDIRYTFPCFRDWQTELIFLFVRKQYYLDVPYMKMGPDSTIEHEDFERQRVMPWCGPGQIVSTNSDDGQVLIGGYSEIKQVYIDSRFHGFHDTLEQIGLPSVEKQAFALKILRKQSSEGLEELYQREIKYLKVFSGKRSRHLVTLLMTFMHKDDRHFLFPWAAGDLSHYWYTQQTQPRVWENVQWFSKQLAGLVEAVSVIHWPTHLDHQYARHGDLKPENILWYNPYNLDPRGILVVSDMGLTIAHQTYSRSKDPAAHIGGTLEYRSPEVDIDKHIEKVYASRNIDIWALGCIFLEMLVFFLGGKDELQQFKNSRGKPDFQGGLTYNFYKLSRDVTPPAEVKQSVLSCMNGIRQHKNRSQFTDAVVNIVQQHMIVVDTSQRADIKDLQKEFAGVDKECRKQRAPNTGTGSRVYNILRDPV